MRKRSRGLSTVVTTMIMLVSMATIGSSLLAGANSIFNTKSLSISETFQNQTNSLKEDFMIEEVKFKSNSSSINMAPGDGRMVYGVSSNSTALTRLWLSSSNTWGTETKANTAASNIDFVVTEVSPLGSEIITLLATSTQTMYVQGFNGMQWTSYWNHDVDFEQTSVGVGRSFDIEFEQLSGRALVVYRDGTIAGGDTVPHYRIWDGTSWSADATITNAPTGTVAWIKLAAKPNSNEIALAWTDNGSPATLKVIFWNGNSWVNPSTLATDLNVANIHKFDIAYEKSGDLQLLAVFSSNTANQLRYRTWGGSSWSAVSTVTGSFGAGNAVRQVLLAPDPSTDDIFVGACAGTVADLGAATWNGASMNSLTVLDTDVKCDEWIPGLGNNFAIAAVGSSAKAVIAYNDRTVATKDFDWALWNGSTWSVQTDVIANMGTTLGIDLDSVTGVNKVVATTHDFSGNLYGFVYDGTSWSATNGGSSLKTGMPALGVKPFDLSITAVSSSSGNQVQLALTNVGKISVTVKEIYFNNVVKWTGSTTITPNNFSTINVNFNWQSGSYEIKVVTSRGNILTQTWITK